MASRRKIGLIVGGLLIVTAAVAAFALGVVGIPATVSAGGQVEVCGGLRIGVTSSGQTVRLAGASDESLAPGDRARVAPLCVVEVVEITETESDPDDDGGSARIQLRWRVG